MADHAIQSSSRSRLMRRWLKVCGSLVSSVIIYIASIGPLAVLERQGIGTQSAWEQLHETFYHPIFRSWHRGPKWVSSSLRWYVGLFVGESKDFDLRQSFAADSNHYRRWYHFFQQACERRTRENPDFGRSGIGAQDAKKIKREIDELL